MSRFSIDFSNYSNYLQKSASRQPRTDLPKCGQSPTLDPPPPFGGQRNIHASSRARPRGTAGRPPARGPGGRRRRNRAPSPSPRACRTCVDTNSLQISPGICRNVHQQIRQKRVLIVRDGLHTSCFALLTSDTDIHQFITVGDGVRAIVAQNSKFCDGSAWSTT